MAIDGKPDTSPPHFETIFYTATLDDMLDLINNFHEPISSIFHWRYSEVVGKQISSAQQNHLQLSFQRPQYSTPFPTSHPQYMGPCHASEPNHSERDQPVHQPVHVQMSRRSGGHHDTHKEQHT